MGRKSGGSSAPAKPEAPWTPEILRVVTVTPSDGEAAPADKPSVDPAPDPAKDGKDGAGKDTAKGGTEKKAAPAALRVRGLTLPRNLEKPVLLYFHWPHEDGARGKEVRKFCDGPLDDEAFCRAAWLFHCVSVNTKLSDPRIVEELKVAAPPALLLCRADGTVVWRSEDKSVAGSRLAAALLEVVKKEFPDRWKGVQEEMDRQARDLRAAEDLLRKDKVQEAVDLLSGIVDSDVRFGQAWEDAGRLLRTAKAREPDPRSK